MGLWPNTYGFQDTLKNIKILIYNHRCTQMDADIILELILCKTQNNYSSLYLFSSIRVYLCPSVVETHFFYSKTGRYVVIFPVSVRVRLLLIRCGTSHAGDYNSRCGYPDVLS